MDSLHFYGSRMKPAVLKIVLFLFISIQLASGDVRINEVALKNSSNVEISYVELFNEGPDSSAMDYLLVFYNKSVISLTIHRLNDTEFAANETFLVLAENDTLSIPTDVAYINDSVLPMLTGNEIGVALFRLDNNTVFSLIQVGSDVPNATLLDSVVITTQFIDNFNMTDLNKGFPDAEQVVLVNLTNSVSFCDDGNVKIWQNSTRSPGVTNDCLAVPTISPVSQITTKSSLSSSTTSVTKANVSSTTPASTISPVSTPTAPNSTTASITAAPSSTTNLTTTTATSPPSSTTVIPVSTPTPSVYIPRNIVISEVYVNPPSEGDLGEFVELRHLSGEANVSLDNFVLVFYNGANQREYHCMDLSGEVTGLEGYYVISNINDSYTQNLQDKTHFIQNGPMDAIVLYYNISCNENEVLKNNIVDGVIYTTTRHNPPLELLHDLFPKQPSAVHIFPLSQHTTVVRCFSNATMNLASFTATNITTKGDRNICPSPNGLRINEFKMTDEKFIEIISVEKTFFPLEQMILVTFNALTNETTGGVRLVGSTNTNLALLTHVPNVTGSLQVDKGNLETLLNSLSPDSPGGIALYWRPDTDVDPMIPLTVDGKLDAVVYGTSTINASSEILTALQLEQVNLPANIVNMSVNYCPGNSDNTYVITKPSPNSPNNCSDEKVITTTTAVPSTSTPTTASSTTPKVVLSQFQINEVKLGKSEMPSFVEICGPSTSQMTMFMLAVVVDSDPIKLNSTFVFSSQNFSEEGLFVREGVILPQQNNQDVAVALYNVTSTTSSITTFEQLQSANLLDFVVYRTTKPVETSKLLKALAGEETSQISIWVEPNSDLSVTRCAPALREVWAFWLSTASRNATNICRLPRILINEINADNPSYDYYEFLELYDFGVGGLSLNPFVLVSFNGKNVAKRAIVINLWNEKTDENGFFLLAVAGQNLSKVADKNVMSTYFFQNGPDAIALYKATPSEFNETSQPTTHNLLDVVIYGKDAKHPLLTQLISALTPDGSSVTTQQSNKVDLSMTRCYCWGWDASKNAKAFVLSKPTPKMINICPSNFTIELPPLEKIFINELNTESSGSPKEGFIELKGNGSASLQYFSLVIYYGSGDHVPLTIPLGGFSLDESGYFVIGGSNGTRIPLTTKLFLDDGFGAVALYDHRQWPCIPQMNMTLERPGLIDAIVYYPAQQEMKQTVVERYLQALRLDGVLEDFKVYTKDQSISRCSDEYLLNSTMYNMAPATPGKENHCPSEKYKLQISFRLINADCETFVTRNELLDFVAKYIVHRVNAKCNCGFTLSNFNSYKFVCGSLILDGEIYAVSDEQKSQIQTAYETFVKKTPTFDLEGKTYKVDNTCFRHCRPVNPANNHQPKKDNTVTIAVVVSVLVVMLIVAIVAAVLFVRKKKKGIVHLRMARFDSEDQNLTMGDMDDFVGGSAEQASFANPMYFKS